MTGAADDSDETVAFYSAVAHTYDAEVLSYPNVTEEYIAKVTSLMPTGKRCIELACGTGNWTGVLAERFSDVLAVDASCEMLQIAIAKHGHGRGNTQFLQGDLLLCMEHGDILLRFAVQGFR